MARSRWDLRTFLAELKCRRVFRVVIVYVVAGLVVVEAANNLLPALNLPCWTATFVVALAILAEASAPFRAAAQRPTLRCPG